MLPTALRLYEVLPAELSWATAARPWQRRRRARLMLRRDIQAARAWYDTVANEVPRGESMPQWYRASLNRSSGFSVGFSSGEEGGLEFELAQKKRMRIL